MTRIALKNIDFAGICASILCLLHCLAIPVLVILGRDSVLWFSEIWWIESLIIFSALIIGLVAFWGGYTVHKQHIIPVLFVAGFLLLITGEAVGHQWLGIVLSVVGAIVIAYAHYQNMLFRLKTAEEKYVN